MPVDDSAEVADAQSEVEIPDEAPIVEAEPASSEEITIPDLPPLPDISIDDTTSIPVIPIAEPSTDDIYPINTEENPSDINSELSPFPKPEDINDSSNESGIE